MTLLNVLIFSLEHLSRLSLNYNASIIKNLLDFHRIFSFEKIALTYCQIPIASVLGYRKNRMKKTKQKDSYTENNLVFAKEGGRMGKVEEGD